MAYEGRDAVVRIRDLEFDAGKRRVSAAGHETLLDSRSSRILAALVERFGQRIEKDELLSLAWPNQVVHENSLAKAISKIRRAIRGSGLEIVVSYGSGYTLRETPDACDASSPDQRASSSPHPLKARFSRIGIPAALGFLLLVVAGSLAVAWVERTYAVRQSDPVTHDAPDAVARILWVDDHPKNNELDVAFLREKKIAVHLATSTDEALQLLEMNRYQLVVSDLGRGEDRLAGLGLIAAMKARRLDVPVIIYTVRPDTASGAEAQRRLAAKGGAAALAVTPQQVRGEILQQLARHPA